MKVMLYTHKGHVTPPDNHQTINHYTFNSIEEQQHGLHGKEKTHRLITFCVLTHIIMYIQDLEVQNLKCSSVNIKAFILLNTMAADKDFILLNQTRRQISTCVHRFEGGKHLKIHLSFPLLPLSFLSSQSSHRRATEGRRENCGGEKGQLLRD